MTPFSDPEDLKANGRRHYSENRETIKEKVRARTVLNRATILPYLKDYHLRRKYGVTAEEKARMLAAQGGVCAICNTDSPGRKGWCVDHGHETGKVRWILCQDCNLRVVQVLESPIRAMAEVYLAHHAALNVVALPQCPLCAKEFHMGTPCEVAP